MPLERRFESVDPAMVQRGRELLEAVRQEVPSSALRLVPLLDARTGFRFHREAKAIARFGRLDWRWVMLANVSYDLALAYMACSTVALPTPDGPVVARNMDWWPEEKLAAASCALHSVRGGRLEYAIAGWPGSMGVVTGLSGRGFAVVLNAVLSDEKYRLTGYPVLLFLRTVLQDAPNFDQAVEMLSGHRLFTNGLITVVGTANHERVCIERTPSRCFLRWGEGGDPLVTTNSYVALEDTGRNRYGPEIEELFASTGSRYSNLLRLSRDINVKGEGLTTALLYALTDEGVIQSITAQHVVMQPSKQHIDVFVPRRLLASTH